ncbi:hypothetical protein [Parapedobacter koreensis]|uniref:Outer membrane protein beta-barrel domain-containing protein n=1 Tax=Parapedobacter koreensis TaxID=332977 RepID=A0A1H7NM04_9SPHI|nr:hypothetical protein [Parapedobacter koreensis]SEL24573.1 hypothetical protein SAMN05421740_10438 [Parapedobacter koreensis]
MYHKYLKQPLVYLLISFPYWVSGQNNNAWTLGLSATSKQISEANISSRIFDAYGVGFSLTKQLKSEYFTQQFGLYANLNLAKTAIEQSYRSYIAQINLEYAYLKDLKLSSPSVAIGPFAMIDYRNATYRNFDNTHIYWANFAGIGIKSKMEIPLNAIWSIQGSLKLPLIGVGFRPSANRLYSFDDTSVSGILKSNHTNARFSAINNYINPAFVIGLRSNEKGFLHNISYQFDYLQYDHPKANRYRDLTHSLAITINL